MQASDIIQYIVIPSIAVLAGASVVAILWIRYKRRQKRQDLEQQRFQQSLATPWNFHAFAQQPNYQMQHQSSLQKENLHQQPPGGLQSYAMVQYPTPVAQGPPGYYAPVVHGHGQQQ
ncbi:hypothetical protein BJY01DRAFT_190899 [Aspergillus pseudoustus]|uniref:Uncharacterized protein n=1 Tax=Aspergillus pseudoustus TaxID=1810923 RepID=A0ABR4JV79_9EURO